MKKLIVLFISFLLTISCGTNQKVVKLLKEGTTKQKDFKTIIPFEYRLGLIIVKVKIQGEYYDFLLDTGAPTTLSPELAQKLNTETLYKEKTYGIDGKSKVLDFVQLNKISIDSIDFLNVGAAITNFNDVSTFKCLNVEGFIGANLMKQAIWSFDFKKKEITIYSSKDQIDSLETYKKASLFVGYGGVPSITTRVNNVKFLNNTVDFGYNSGVVLSSKDFEKLNKKNEIKNFITGTGGTSVGIYGETKSRKSDKAIVNNLTSGEFNIENQIIDFVSNYKRTLGLSFFKNYKVILNWDDKEIFIKDNYLYNKSEYKTFGYGIILKDDKLVVNFLYHNSDADTKGIKIGDQIISIDDKDTSHLSQEDYCDVLQRQRGDEEHLTIKRNDKTFHLTLHKTTLLK